MPTLYWWIGASFCHPRFLLLHDECYPTKSPIQCLRAFPILFLLSYYCYCYYYNCYKTITTITVTIVTVTAAIKLSYYCATDHFALDIWSPGVVELTTQLLILTNILWLPLCRIYKFGLNNLPSRTVAIPYTCGF